MIKLFITDIDGCLTEPFKTPDWEVLEQIKSLNEQSTEDSRIPPLTICTGRPLPYAEAIAQWMDVQLPIVFESAGVFRLSDYSITVNGTFSENAERQVVELKEWLKNEVISGYPGMQAEFFKLMDAGLIHPGEEVIQKALPKVQQHVERHYPNFEVHHTSVSINILLKGNNKSNGIMKLCDLQDIEPSEAAYIGDSSGDIPGLSAVGLPFAPNNATEEVKQVAEAIPLKSTRAVLRAYEIIINKNRS